MILFSRLRPCPRSLLANSQNRTNVERCMSSFGKVGEHYSYRDSWTPSHVLPWNTNNSRSQSLNKSPESLLARYKIQLSQCSQGGLAAKAFRICRDMKLNGIKPDLTCYNLLLFTCSKKSLGKECLALFDDMSELQLTPNIETYNYVLAAQRGNKSFDLGRVLAAMEADGIIPDAQTYHHMIAFYHASDNMEMCLQLFGELNALGLAPQLATIRFLLGLAVQQRQARLALDIAQVFESSSWRRLESEDWIDILTVSAFCYFEEGIVTAWQRTVRELGVNPDEGLCIHILNAAAHLGLVEIATQTLQVLVKLDVPLEEYHLVPLLEAHCNRGNLQEALSILNMMQTKSNIQVSTSTGRPIAKLLPDIDALDHAWQILERTRDEGTPVSIFALNVVLHATAATSIGDLQRGIGIYKALPEFQVQANVETFNLLLRLCVKERHKELGVKLLQDLHDLGLIPDSVTFEQMIYVCLTQKNYEDVFHYLEEMKSVGFKPSYGVYFRIIRKCLYNKDERWQIALEELREWGYNIDPRLQASIDSGGERAGDEVGPDLDIGDDVHVVEQVITHQKY